MRKELLECLVCPVCKNALSAQVFSEMDGRVEEGVLSCPSCLKKYAVVGFVPRMVPTYLFPVAAFCERHALDEEQFLGKWDDEVREIADIQVHTQDNFGHEWEYYSKLGWHEEVGVDASHRDESVKWFHEKSLLTTDDVAGKWVLDAGCGNGRFSRAACNAGANVVSMDLTKAADVAYSNLSEIGHQARVVQGDILHSPFKEGTFDVVFTIGVIQHTGDPLKAAACLASLVKSDGLFSVRTYQLGNERLEENDAAIRAVTTQFTLEELHEFSDILSKLTGFLLRKRLYAKVARHVNLFPKRYDIFDWYSAPVAAKLTYGELRDVYAAAGFDVVRDADDGSLPEQRAFTAISIVGRKKRRNVQ